MGAFWIALAFVSCHKSQHRELSLAYEMAQHNPDSALVLLNGINQNKLSDENLAKYALIYYMAQDKSGLDVDNDSLIRIAYNWYNEHQEDTLYALCLNYIGTYYLLVDSIEQTKACLEKSFLIADRSHNLKVKSLALSKLIDIEERLVPHKALKYAKTLAKMYDMMPNEPLYNKVAAHIKLCESFLFVDSLQQALKEGRIAQKLAKKSNDKILASSAAQDLSNIFEELGDLDSCLYYAQRAYDLQQGKSFSGQLALASAYIAVDSSKQAFQILKKATPKTSEDQYSVYYMQSQAAMKSLDYMSAKIFTDSASHCIEKMYQTALQAKASYYNTCLRKESEKIKMQGESEKQRWIFGLTVLLSFTIIVFILYIHKLYKRQALARLAHEQEIYNQRCQMQKKLHKEELSHKEIQLTIMRNYLQKKIDIVEKLNSYTFTENKHIVLSEKDWTEIEVFLDCVEDLFATRLKQKHPKLSKNDLHLMMLLRLRLSQKALASIYCISEKAIKQKLFLYKEKVGIKNEHYSLRKYIENF